MKTTIQIPDDIWRKLNIEAAENHQKGFSGIVAEAVESYLKRKDRARHLNERRKRRQIAGELFGSLSSAEAVDELSNLRERRKQWHTNS
ncbi:hypothetical protein [Turneriella parva]|uniref:Uncharacterized protein n=1 Tax=Turneriella parva (strain ATCC BAA-1111 / DSM 21527 / NCTC 11395 / H) TaxID=869212 RepID=I4B132_TURPD|nr:hypothetical protein [Turneriella parva]AFM10989.1 hypothetical protein Turpa_0329 [Turneriella parva DSM 21527]